MLLVFPLLLTFYVILLFLSNGNNNFSFSLDVNDFKCLALRNTVIEGRGEWDEAKYQSNLTVMTKLWDEIALLADFDKVR